MVHKTKLFIMIFSCVALTASVQAANMIATKDHQPIKAKIIDATPSKYTIDVKNFSNMGVDESAPTFAVYTSRKMPEKCVDFLSKELTYTKPSKYLRQFDLSQNEAVLNAIDTHNCVVIKNIPPK